MKRLILILTLFFISQSFTFYHSTFQQSVQGISFDSTYYNSELFGVGESSHGSSENNQVRNELFKRYVAEKGCRFLFIEASYEEGLILNEYLVYNRITLDSAMESLAFWTWNTVEFSELFIWINLYNSDKPFSQKIRVVGVDVQGVSAAMDYLTGFLNLNRKDSTVVENLKLFRSYYKKGMRQEPEKYLTPLTILRDSVKLQFIKPSRNYNELDQEMINFYFQYVEEIILENKGEQYIGFAKRDSMMAKNVIRLKKIFSQKSSVFLYAHNGHVSNDSYPYKDGIIFKSLGHHLKAEFGSKYFIVGIDFRRGKVTSRKFKFGFLGALRGKYTDLKSVQVKNPAKGTFLSEKSPIYSFSYFSSDQLIKTKERLGSKMEIHNIGAVYFKPITFLEYKIGMFDGLIVFDKSSPTVSYFGGF